MEKGNIAPSSGKESHWKLLRLVLINFIYLINNKEGHHDTIIKGGDDGDGSQTDTGWSREEEGDTTAHSMKFQEVLGWDFIKFSCEFWINEIIKNNEKAKTINLRRLASLSLAFLQHLLLSRELVWWFEMHLIPIIILENVKLCVYAWLSLCRRLLGNFSEYWRVPLKGLPWGSFEKANSPWFG